MFLSIFLACHEESERTPDEDSGPRNATDQIDTVPQENPLNVVLFTFDTLRPQDALEEMDTLGAMIAGEEGVRFIAHAASGSWTYMSMVAMLTGFNPTHFGAEALAWNGDDPPILPDSATTLAEILWAKGYATALFSGSPIMGPQTGLSVGYDTIVAPESDEIPSIELIQGPIEWVAAQSGPWFLHVHFMDPHGPYNLLQGCTSSEIDAVFALQAVCGYDFSDAKVGKRMNDELETWDDSTLAACQTAVRESIRCEARTLDHNFGLLVDGLGEAMTNALIIAINDHSEGIGESLIDRKFDHGDTQTASSTAAFAWMSLPDDETVNIDVTTTHVDVLPSILDVLGVNTGPLDGIPAWEATTERISASFACIETDSVDSVFTGDGLYQLILRDSGSPWLFDRQRDPTNSTDLSSKGIPADLLAAGEARAAQTEGLCPNE